MTVCSLAVLMVGVGLGGWGINSTGSKLVCVAFSTNYCPQAALLCCYSFSDATRCYEMLQENDAGPTSIIDAILCKVSSCGSH